MLAVGESRACTGCRDNIIKSQIGAYGHAIEINGKKCTEGEK
jgi:hypothetical protein